jgi:hypothetical protein
MEAEGEIMLAFQLSLLAFGGVVGLLIASGLRRRRLDWDVVSRASGLIVFGFIAATWIGCSFMLFDGSLLWIFIGCSLEINIPPLIVIATRPIVPKSVDRNA